MSDLSVIMADGFILVKPIIETTDPKTGLEIPPQLQKNKNKAEVIAVCEQYYFDGHILDVPWKKGDTVFVRNYEDYLLEHNGEKYFFVECSDVMGQLNG